MSESQPEPAPPSRQSNIIHTPRLLLRPMTMDDVDALYEVTAHPEVMQHYVDLPPGATGWTRERTVALVEKSQRSWEVNDFGFWTAELAGDAARELGGGIAGFCGLDKLDWLPGAERQAAFEYWFHPRVWGRGIGLECAMSVVAWAGVARQLTSVVAAVARGNDASKHVLTTFMGEFASFLYTSPISGKLAEFDVLEIALPPVVTLPGRHDPACPPLREIVQRLPLPGDPRCGPPVVRRSHGTGTGSANAKPTT